jgi:predicted CopG family antitoxin
MLPKRQSGYKRRTISIDDDVYLRLRQKGKFGESFGRLISRILDQTDDVGAYNT